MADKAQATTLDIAQVDRPQWVQRQLGRLLADIARQTSSAAETP
jgi:hypothetical protein